MTKETNQSPYECPFGFKFGQDIDRYECCNNCTNIGYCDAASEDRLPMIKTCGKNPLIDDCTDCSRSRQCGEYQSRYIRIPHYIIDGIMGRLSPTAFKIFVYLCRKASYAKAGNNYARCFLTYSQIKNDTGIAVAPMRKYMRELEKHGLIKFDFKVQNAKGFTTLHSFTITALKRLDKMIEENKPSPMRKYRK